MNQDITIYVRRIGNGYTVSRSMDTERGYIHDDAWYFADTDGVKARLADYIDNADEDAETLPIAPGQGF